MDIWTPGVPFAELLLRAAVVYFALLLLVRLSGKRTVGQFTPFDLVVVMLISEAVTGALSAEDTSITGGLVVAATLIALNYGMGFLTARSKTADRLVEGSPVLVARDGAIYKEALRRQNISEADFRESMRKHGIPREEQIRFAFLETNGEITIVDREAAAKP
ncbi:MAG TPA: YetF domain-containing protein [Xanthomonadales bacterium]|nr:YetF domain-containing protein [Xanthomonadales bacterium]